jgi:DNA invertase Pin-like site-specific DNA recombinase
MVIAYLKGKNKRLSTLEQQDFIINYAKKKNIAIKMTEIDNDLPSLALEKRFTLLDLLNMLKSGDKIFVYDLWVFSQKVGELAKVFDCILRHGIIVHVCKRELTIKSDIPAGVLINLLSEQREKNLIDKKSSMGRPKGSFSKSKFDVYKNQIVKMIQEELSVSEIAKRLGVSRSSLKDYINSRSLKDIALSTVISEGDSSDINESFVLPDPNECPLTDKKT